MIEAVSAYAGELLPGFYEEWIIWERERLAAVYEDRMQVLLGRLVQEERWRETCEWAERWIAGGQVPEPAYRALMLAHAGLGDQAGMAEVYQRCVATLEEELGVAPAQETVQLFQRLSRGETTPRPPIEAGPPQRRSNLSTPPTPFVGREALLAEIATRLKEPACRLWWKIHCFTAIPGNATRYTNCCRSMLPTDYVGPINYIGPTDYVGLTNTPHPWLPWKRRATGTAPTMSAFWGAGVRT